MSHNQPLSSRSSHIYPQISKISLWLYLTTCFLEVLFRSYLFVCGRVGRILAGNPIPSCSRLLDPKESGHVVEVATK